MNDVVGQLSLIALPEEVFYRGYLQTRLDDAWPLRVRLFGASVGPSVVVTSAIFALGHLLTIHDPGRLAVFFPSLVFGWLRARTGGSAPRSRSTRSATSSRHAAPGVRPALTTGTMPRAALFDMDRTLVRKETASLYVRYQRESGEATLRDLARVLSGSRSTRWASSTPGGRAPGARGLPRHVGDADGGRCDDWFTRYVEHHITELGRAAVERHRAQVTSSPSSRARPPTWRARSRDACASSTW